LTDYPTADFYGAAISGTSAAAGAVQTPVQGTGFVLNYAAQGPGTVAVTSGTVDGDGFADGTVVLTAQANSGGIFGYWIVNGSVDGETSPVLNMNMDAHKTVLAVFYINVTSSGNDGPGSLREALAAAVPAGDTIYLSPAGGTITLTSPLDQITKSLVIEGNGATLTQTGFTASATSHLLYINSTSATVRISRLHFKGGRATGYAAAIRNSGNLILESCIFSNNQSSAGNAWGGAIYNLSGSLTVLGCTFSGNQAGASTGLGGAIYRGGGTVTLAGNIFSGNTVTGTTAQGSVVYVAAASASSVTSSGYNVSDKSSGTGATNTTESGWTFDATDGTLTDVNFDADFKPSSATGLPQIPALTSLPAGFPAAYFNGTTRGTNFAPGAMPAGN
jgi:hypothetical protein